MTTRGYSGLMRRFRLAVATLAVPLLASCGESEPGSLLSELTVTDTGFEAWPAWLPNNVVALTFDDGPDGTVTPRVLDVLKAKGVKATFFVNTENYGSVNNDPTLKALIQRMVAEGHQLANHTVHHPHLPTLTAAQIDAEITGVQQMIERTDVLGAVAPKLTLLRAPFGEPYQDGPGAHGYDLVTQTVSKYAVHVGWQIDPEDYSCGGGAAAKAQCVYSNVVSRLGTVGTGEYGVVLLHSTQAQTADALPAIIDYCVSHNFVFVLAEDVVKAKFGVSSYQIVYGGACTAETDAQFCARLGKACGSVSAPDNCGTPRTVSSCGACLSPETCGGGGTPNVCGIPASTGSCSFTVASNTYSGPSYWGTVAFTNTGSLAWTNPTVIFGVPSGVTCDYADTGWAVTQSGPGQDCTFTRLSALTVAPGEMLSMGISTDSSASSFTATTSPRLTDPACAGGDTCAAETDAAFCARLQKNCGSVSGTDNCGAPRTVSSCGACTPPATCGGGGTENVCGGSPTGACLATVTTNTYNGPSYWGTVAFTNSGATAWTKPTIAFGVPPGVICDYADHGWKVAQAAAGQVCTFTRTSKLTVAAGGTLTMNISTDSNSSSFIATTDPTVTSCHN